MEAWIGSGLWIIFLLCLCVFALRRRWRRRHQRCPCCAAWVRATFAYCQWCGLPQFTQGPAMPQPHPKTDGQRETMLVPEQAVRSRVRTCPRCYAGQGSKNSLCWQCGSTILFWMEKDS